MWLRARALFAGSRSVDRVRVDQLTGLLLLIASELTTWLGSPTQGRVISAVAGVLLSLAVAVRRRWPLGEILVVLAGWTIGVGIDSRHGPPGAWLPVAITLLTYGAGAFAQERRSLGVLGLAVVVIAIDGLAAGGRQASNLPPTEILGLLLPYAIGRTVRARAARERSYREQSERLDAGRDEGALM